MLFSNYRWLNGFMNITHLSLGFEAFLLILAAGAFAVSYVSEKTFFPQLARLLGAAKTAIRPGSAKKRKQYKIISDTMAIG